MAALLATLLAATAVRSQSLELETGNDWRLESAVAANDGGLWLLTSIPGTSTYRRYGLTKISEDLAVEYERSMPPTMPRGIIAFRDGLLTILRDDRPANAGSIAGFEDRFHLVWIQDDLQPTTLFSWQSRDEPSAQRYVAIAPDQGAIYLMPAKRSEPAIVRLGPDGTVQWRHELGAEQFQALVATPEGVVVLQNLRQGVRRLVAISAAGDALWDMELTIERAISLSGLSFVPPRTLVLEPQLPEDELQRLELIDTVDRTRRTVTVPASYGRILPVPGGFLYTGVALDRTLVAFVGEDGRVAWTQRLEDASVREILGQNSIAVFSNVTDSAGISRVRIERASPERMALAERFGRCLGADATPILERERAILRNYGIRVRLRSPFPRDTQPVDDRGCVLPSDAEYLQFLDDFSGELLRLAANRHEPYITSFSIAVDALDVPFVMTFFGFNRRIEDAPDTEVRYVAHPGSGQALAQHVASVGAHVQRMASLSRALYDDWQCTLTVRTESREREAGDADRFFAALEETASVIVEAASRIEPPEPSEEYGSCGGSVVIFDEDSLAVGDQQGPVREARGILRDFSAGTRQ